jgi:6,7-dimethyl-8-ribityllumazine synthase
MMPTTDTQRIAFVQARWHAALVDGCRISFEDEMVKLGVEKDLLDWFEVPGAFELPLRVQRLARSGDYSAIVAAGLVVDGGIYRHEFVADAVINGLMRVQLDTGVPVLSAVLTPHHFHEHADHVSFFQLHLEEKGREAARACADTVRSFATL